MSDPDTMMKEERKFFPLVVFIKINEKLRPNIIKMYLDERHLWKPAYAKMVADFINYERLK